MLFIKLGVTLLFLHISTAHTENPDWDLAVLVSNQVELLASNGTLVGSIEALFSKLKAITFDSLRHQLVVSDVNGLNDTIFTVRLTKETDDLERVSAIVEDLPDDVRGLAIDPISQVLYWTDSLNRRINSMSLQNGSTCADGCTPHVFPAADGEMPSSLAIDVCNRYIYWTNTNSVKPTIERSKLDGTDRITLIEDDLKYPSGIAVDHFERRIYWLNKEESIHYTVESADLEGNDRRLVYAGTFVDPWGIAVDTDAIYFTDSNNNALRRIAKSSKEGEQLVTRIRDFDGKPRGIYARNSQIRSLPECEKLKQAVQNYNQSTKEIYDEEPVELLNQEVVVCLNHGHKVDNDVCKCRPGYEGRLCEIEVCHNYCLKGDCYLQEGYPKCRCAAGFMGHRCERDTCDGLCLNGGSCQRHGRSLTTCQCPDEFWGERCEISLHACSSFCKEREDDLRISKENVTCRCVDNLPDSVHNMTSFKESRLGSPIVPEFFQNPAFLTSIVTNLALLILVVSLVAFACKKGGRPRIKKRIIVNKNVTPLTYRPQQQTEQCEITIENCCNMNICETPCFEPPPPKSRKCDDKNKLLAHMENGEDLY